MKREIARRRQMTTNTADLADQSGHSPTSAYVQRILDAVDQHEKASLRRRHVRRQRAEEFRRLTNEIGETWYVRPRLLRRPVGNESPVWSTKTQRVTAVLLTDENIVQAARWVLSSGTDVEGSPDTYEPQSMSIRSRTGRHILAEVGNYLVREFGTWKVYEPSLFVAGHAREAES